MNFDGTDYGFVLHFNRVSKELADTSKKKGFKIKNDGE